MQGDPALRLLQWFRQVARPFPWREAFPRDPYWTLVAEVMLQQTQATRATQAWERFLAAFPTLHHAAAAREEELLVPFSGLGYYRRARLLHAACRALAQRGSWPRTAAELRRLPGIGPYTAAALSAFCFGGEDPPVDGNILRIASRVLALPDPARTPASRRAAEALARSLHAAAPSPEVWEALMELGARVCRPKAPHCPSCPLATVCKARAEGVPAAYPRPTSSRPVEEAVWVALWVTNHAGAVLLQRVPRGLLLAGLWLPPLRPLAAPEDDPSTAARQLAHSLGLAGPLRPLPPVRHAITHRRITVLPFAVAEGCLRAAETLDDRRWELPQAPTLATSSLLAKLARAAEPGAARPRPAHGG